MDLGYLGIFYCQADIARGSQYVVFQDVCFGSLVEHLLNSELVVLGHCST